jgi:NADPH:quinone reductase-like Zn-dependent oxidoreductase
VHAAIVSAFDVAPEYREVPTPTAGPGQELVTVLASAIHPRVRAQADGTHYTSTGELLQVPGIDGVGRTEQGEVRYFLQLGSSSGAMAEQTLINPHASVVLEADVDPVLIAAAVNPAMSSWIALRRRIDFQPGSRVLIMGATGNAGRMAVQIAKRLGASHVTAAARNPGALARLAMLGADTLIDLSRNESLVAADLAAAGKRVDVVLDYLWGGWATTALTAIIPAREDVSQLLIWIQVGSVAGPESLIPSAALRACNLRIIGSGQGSVPARDILAELPGVVSELSTGHYKISTRAVPLRDVAVVWNESTAERVVLIPTR